jgi:hypothetical protein
LKSLANCRAFFIAIHGSCSTLQVFQSFHYKTTITMTELINKLISEAGLSTEQASKTIDVIKGFVAEKFPMLAGAVENVLGAGSSAASSAVPDVTETPSSAGGSWLDKISDVIPGDIGEK